VQITLLKFAKLTIWRWQMIVPFYPQNMS